MFDIEQTATNLRMVRAGRSLSQEQLADRSGVSVSSIRGYERGDIEMGLKNACAIADALGVDLPELVAVVGD